MLFCISTPQSSPRTQVLTGMQRGLQDRNTVILSPFVSKPSLTPLKYPEPTFNMCKSVVFPALSRPRNSSLACLFSKPSAESVSQTIAPSAYPSPNPSQTHPHPSCSLPEHNSPAKGKVKALTPVDHPHAGRVSCFVCVEVRR